MNRPHPDLEPLFTEAFGRFLMKIALPLVDDNWHVAEDVVQHVFLALIKTQSYDPQRSKPSTYAVRRLRGAISHLLEAQRRHKRRLQRLKNVHPIHHVDKNVTEFRDEVDLVRQSVSRLDNRQSFVLCRFERGETLKDVSSKIGLSKQGVQFIEQKAIRLVRKMLSGC